MMSNSLFTLSLFLVNPTEMFSSSNSILFGCGIEPRVSVVAVALNKNTSTTSSGTIPPYLSVLSTIDNANARKLQGILIGRESNSQESNCNIGYIIDSNCYS